MKKYLIILFSWVLLLPLMAQPQILKQSTDKQACEIWVESTLKQLTLKQKIGQLFVYHTDMNMNSRKRELLRTVVKENGVGGLLFYGGTVEQHVEIVNASQELADVPLMITFDGEWGTAMRLKNSPTFPRNRVLGCIQNDDILYRFGQEMARQCKLLGIQVNFAPVADVDNNPANPVINIRSFGSLPQQVANKVMAYSKGLEAGGVMAVVKHFPGHGDTDADSHKSLPVLNFTRERLDSVELYPFKSAFQAGVSGVMTGHLLLPRLDSKPASLSPALTTKLLREELGFKGLIFTDALEMKGVPATEKTSVDAFLAGNDILLAPLHLGKGISALMSAVRSGKISEAEITERCRKVLTYKYALGLSKRPTPIGSNVASLLETTATTALREDMQKAAVTLIKNDRFLLPLDLSESGTTLITVASAMSEGHAFYQALQSQMDLNWVHLKSDALSRIKEELRPAQRLIIAIHQRNLRAYDKVLSELAAEKPTVVVVYTDARAFRDIPQTIATAQTVIWAHSADGVVTTHVAKALIGQERIDGRLSIPILNFPAGTGVTLDPQASPVTYRPSDFGMNEKVLEQIDAVATEGIAAGAYPGCRVLVLKDGFPVYNKSFGHYTYEKEQEVTADTMYDLASLSKTTGTLLAIMKLYDEGKIGLVDPVSKYLPQYAGKAVGRVSVQALLLHESGLPAFYPFYQELIRKETLPRGFYKRTKDNDYTLQVEDRLYANTSYAFDTVWVSTVPTAEHTLPMADHLFISPRFREKVLEMIGDFSLRGTSYKYSDLNFILLKEIAEAISRQPLDKYLSEQFFQPMGLLHTAYNPLRTFSKEQIAPTVKYDVLKRGLLQGYVHDEAASVLGGVAGHAGLFSTATDVAKIYQMLLNKGVMGDKRYLNRSTCTLFLDFKAKGSRRGLGFDKPDTRNPDKSPCAEGVPGSVFGHTGFTGTCVWADPDNRLVYVFLSNRIYPQVYGRNALGRLEIRPRIQGLIYDSLK